jgi:hypothetical protein
MVRGYALDPEDGSLTGNSLSWSSNVDGGLGSGSPLLVSLSEGDHILTLTATDSSGHSTSVSVTVRVLTHFYSFVPLIRR